MRLKISNFAKIKQADILVDGITIIAGENNTGKSTIGKILFSLFNSISDIDRRIKQQREEAVQTVCYLFFLNYPIRSYIQKNVFRTPKDLSYKLSADIIHYLKQQDYSNDDEFIEGVSQLVIKWGNDAEIGDINPKELQELVAEKLLPIIKLSDYKITLEVLSRYFKEVFLGQMNSLINDDSPAKIELNIKEKLVNLVFEDNYCADFQSEISILHNAVYIGNPLVIDDLSRFESGNVLDDYLIEILTSRAKSDVMDGIIESVLARERFNEIFAKMEAVVKGNIVEKSDDEYFLEEEGMARPVSFNNLSTGLKSFVLLKMLIEKQCIKQRDVLILDEPEVHLHPEWQLVYAEIIVLLQKEFELSVILTTHSAHFLECIDYFSKKHDCVEKCNYYLAIDHQNQITFENVNDSLDKIYSQMVTPSILLDRLKFEIENEEDEYL